MMVQQHYGNRAVQRLIGGSSTTIQRARLFDLFKGKKKEAKTPPADVDDMLESDVYPYFKEYCKDDECLELVNFYEAVKNYKQNVNIGLAREIYNRFVDSSAKEKLNIPDNDREVAISFLHPKKFNSEGDKMFNKILKKVIEDMRDPYFQFRQSKHFKDWQNA